MITVSPEGNETGTFTADHVTAISEGYIGIVKGEKAVLIDKKGETVFESKKYKLIAPPVHGCCMAISQEGNFGLLDMKGEEIIRPKYNIIMPIDDNLLVAVKEGKLGAIDRNDEKKIDFEYIDLEVLGNNFLAKDGSTWIVIGRDGKRIGKQEFYSHSTSPCGKYIHYINVDALAEAVTSLVPQFSPANTVSQVAQKLDKKPSDEYASTDRLSDAKTMAGQVATIYYTFNSYGLSEEKFHEETKNDGWFDNVEQVSDGWAWKEDVNMTSLTVIFPTIEGDTNQTIDILVARMKQNGYQPSGYNERIVVKDGHRIAFDTYGNGIKAEIDAAADAPGC